MMDTYHMEYYTKDGRRVGVQISAYCSQDVINYAEQLPNYDYMVSFPEKIQTGNNWG